MIQHGKPKEIIPSLAESFSAHTTLPDYLLQSTTLEEFGIGDCHILERCYRVEIAENRAKDCGIPKIRIYESPDDLESSSPSVVSLHDDVENQTEIADVNDS
ncbi:hypothetical protein Ddye_028710 [Dipteronia dyeriana]|uniref:Uncharacterized protein n=1 Tax=Dipteronia dyeriana TaxID=168575 RepID=A0AAD9WL34_9ROSI|nr:hypothetical protein Ddye_028710 [Dipteronia dyeriana]